MSAPDQSGLYRPDFEHDGCGFGLIAQMDGQASHALVHRAIGALSRLTHRGAVAADGKSGDGCGLLLRLPDTFLRAAAGEADIELAARFAVGMLFLNPDPDLAVAARWRLGYELEAQGLAVAGWRRVPIDTGACGQRALETLPRIEQLFVNAPPAARRGRAGAAAVHRPAPRQEGAQGRGSALLRRQPVLSRDLLQGPGHAAQPAGVLSGPA